MLHDLLSIAATKHPHKIAVCDSSDSITYADLESIAKDLAVRLRDFDIDHFPLILVYAEKTVATVATFYGVFSAGGTSVPLDPTAPIDRQCFVARDTGAKLLIADAIGAPRALEIAKASGIPVLIIFERTSRTGATCGSWHIDYVGDQKSRPSLDQRCQISLDNGAHPAYVLYTSGSTGRPKGVVLSHGNAECFVDWASDYFNLDSTDVMASFAPLYFDMSIFDIFATAKACAELCLIPKGVSEFPVSLRKYIDKKGITTLYSVPSVLVNLIRSQEFIWGIRDSLKRILYAGEPFPIVHLRKLAEALPNTRIYNLYGPTETNVITCYQIDQKRDLVSTSIPIGAPCPYAEILVVDGTQVVTSLGGVGELVVRGDSLMQGYLRRKEQTAKAIRQLEFGKPESPSYYHTGDLVEILEGGNYRFLARNDRLVKVNGYRIEMGEIEHVAMELREIEECVCIARKFDSGEVMLVAFVVRIDESFKTDAIRDYLKVKLPGYMVPNLIITLEMVPRTTTGKCDYSKLLSLAEMGASSPHTI